MKPASTTGIEGPGFTNMHVQCHILVGSYTYVATYYTSSICKSILKATKLQVKLIKPVIIHSINTTTYVAIRSSYVASLCAVWYSYS